MTNVNEKNKKTILIIYKIQNLTRFIVTKQRRHTKYKVTMGKTRGAKSFILPSAGKQDNLKINK